jgi:hypothetical protein
MHKRPLTNKQIFLFWAPLAATWLMMAVEGPFLAAVIARLAEPKYNLAAFGVAFSFAVLIEAPIIMIMSASTALVKNRLTFIKLRNFAYVLNTLVTIGMLLFVFPPIFFLITQKIIGLPENVASITHTASLIMLPWPAAIGYRRFYQGILIRSNLTRRVAYGTLVRLSSMAVTAVSCYLFFDLNGAVVGALALSVAVLAEAVVSKMMARASVKMLLAEMNTNQKEYSLSYRGIMRFYYPLALTSILGIGVHPMMTFFMGQSRMSLESLAVWPVVYSLVFVFRSLGLSYQEVGIALLGEKNEEFTPLRNFTIILGIGVTAALSLVAFTPLSYIWFRKISGLSLELTQFSLVPTMIMTAIPGLMVLLSFQRSLLVNCRRTKPITLATSIEVVTIVLMLLLTIQWLGMIGVMAASISLIVGRVMANAYLFFPFFQELNKFKKS